MTVLDTFYLLFKSDANGAKTDVAALEKQIDSLTVKGKKRTDEESKALLQAKKQLKGVTQELQDQNKQVDKLGESFRGLITNAVGAFTAYAGFSALKNGILDAAKFNSALAVQAKITGQNAGELGGYAAEVEAAGGSVDEFIGSIQSMTKMAADAGRPLTKIGDLLNFMREQIKGQPLQEQMRILGLVGINSPGYIAFLEQSNDEWRKSVGYINAHAQATNAATDIDRKFEQQLSRTGQTFKDLFSILGKHVLPTATGFLKGTEAWLGVLNFGLQYDDYIGPRPRPQNTKKYDPAARRFVDSSPQSSSGGDAYSFWLSQGYTPSQAAGLAANEQAESSGNPNALNTQTGIHGGLYQWDRSRRASILTGTGIDVYNSSADQQRLAAAWELKQRGDDIRIRNTVSPEDAAAVTNAYFERSGENPASRAIMAGRIAQSHISAGSSIAPAIGGSAGAIGPQSYNIKIDGIHVNTQATDAAGIARNINSALRNEITIAIANSDDGQFA